MSRIGKQPINIPDGVEITIADDFVVAKGPKGELKQKLTQNVNARINEKRIFVSVLNPKDKGHRALWGLYQRLIGNMVKGVTEGYEKKLEMVGVGYKASLSGKILKIEAGFSHAVDFELPEGIEAAVEKTSITISGIDKQLVGEIAARIRKIRKPEPYKGKGIRYAGEAIRRKAGKAQKAAA